MEFDLYEHCGVDIITLQILKSTIFKNMTSLFFFIFVMIKSFYYRISKQALKISFMGHCQYRCSLSQCLKSRATGVISHLNALENNSTVSV